MNVSSLSEHFILPSPIQKLELKGHPLLNLFIKRDDLIHPAISGNKWRKLKGFVREYYEKEHKSIVTFGGAFSNHIVATAILCNKLNIPCTAYIRTDSIDPSNDALNLCSRNGMNLIPMNRERYQQKDSLEVLRDIIIQHDGALIIPEGGSSPLAIEGMNEVVYEANIQVDSIDEFICSFGTGGTASGILDALSNNQKLLICPAIKGVHMDSFLTNLKSFGVTNSNKAFELRYHPLDKSYARKDLELFSFIETFLLEHSILLDPIYTGKAMRNFLSLLESSDDKTYCFVHTGGLQAWNGYFYRFPILREKLPAIYEYMQGFNRTLVE